MRLLSLLLLILGSSLVRAAGSEPGVTLIYNESRPGEPSSMVRYIIKGNSMRSDYGPDGSGFVLFDGDERSIYSVNEQDQSIIVIRPRAVAVETPPDLALTESRVDGSTLPEVNGAAPEHYRLSASGTVCEDVYALPGVLEQVLPVLRAYRTVLALEQQGTVDRIPAEFREPCEMARYVYAPARHLRHGLLIRQENERGFLRELVTYREHEAVNPALFVLPAHYRRISISDLNIPLE